MALTLQQLHVFSQLFFYILFLWLLPPEDVGWICDIRECASPDRPVQGWSLADALLSLCAPCFLKRQIPWLWSGPYAWFPRCSVRFWSYVPWCNRARSRLPTVDSLVHYMRGGPIYSRFQDMTSWGRLILFCGQPKKHSNLNENHPELPSWRHHQILHPRLISL